MSLPDRLPHLCDIYESIPIQDELIGDRDEPSKVSSNVACWVQPASDNQQVIHQRRDQYVTHKVYFRGNPNLRPGYIIVPKDGADVSCPFAGANLKVLSGNEATAGLSILWRIMAEEIQPR